MMHALWGLPQPTQKTGNSSPAGCGRPSAHDARRLASLGSSATAPKPAIAWGMAAKRVCVPSGLRARARAAQGKNEQFMQKKREASLRHNQNKVIKEYMEENN